MKPLLQRYALYNHWANNEYISAIENHGIEDEQVIWQMSHIINAQVLWMDRIAEEPISLQPFEVHDPRDLRQLEEQAYARLKGMIEGFDPQKILEYHSTSGEGYKDRLGDIVLHFIDHCSYHRGQLARRFREIGLEPLKTNFIHWSRALPL